MKTITARQFGELRKCVKDFRAGKCHEAIERIRLIRQEAARNANQELAA